jgi:hypothetical protein
MLRTFLELNAARLRGFYAHVASDAIRKPAFLNYTVPATLFAFPKDTTFFDDAVVFFFF